MTYGEEQLENKLREIIRRIREDLSELDAIEQIHEAYKEYESLPKQTTVERLTYNTANGKGLGWL